MQQKGIRLAFWFCCGFSAAVFLSILALETGRILYFMFAVLPVGLVLLTGKNRTARILSLFLLGAALGFGISYTRLSATLLPSEALSGQEREVMCRVVEMPVHYEENDSVVVLLCGEDTPRVRCRISIYYPAFPEPGDELRCTLRFSSARIRYGEESDSLTAKGIFLRGTVLGEIEKIGRWKYSWLYKPLYWKKQLLRLCSALFPADTAAFHKALLTGDKTELYRDLALHTALSRSGLMHVVAVSGMHVSFLVGFLYLLLPNKRLLAVAASPFLLLFAALTGFTPSVCRAVFMQLVLLLAPLVKREADSPTSLALAMALLLCINPCSAGSVSLQLSFACTAGILLCADSLLGRFTALLPKKGLLRKLLYAPISAIATSFAAMLLVLPLTAIHFGSVSLVSPLTNALCLWLISFLFVGGFVTLGLGAAFPTVGKWAGTVMGWGDRFVFFVAKKLSALPFAAVYTENRLYLWWMLLSYGLLAFFFLKGKREKKETQLLRPLALSLLCLCFVLGYVRAQRQKPGLTVSVIDVGQGSCTLLEQGNAAVMIDCGGTNTLSDAGDTAAAYTLSRGRSELSALILTHLHRDHANGVEKLLSMVRVHKLYLPRNQNAESERAILAAAESHGTEVHYVDEELLLETEELRLRLSPPPEYEEDEPGLFILASYGEFDTLITGDANAFLERRYLQLTACEDVELLLVGHHGSAGATDEKLLDAIKPSAAVISVGYNSYGHPTEKTLNRLESRGIEVYRTDLDGTVRLTGEKDGSINQEKPRQRRS